MNIIGIRHAIPLMLAASDVEYIDFIAKHLGEQRKADVSRSEAVSFLIARHKIKTQKRLAEQRHDAKVLKKRQGAGKIATP